MSCPADQTDIPSAARITMVRTFCARRLASAAMMPLAIRAPRALRLCWSASVMMPTCPCIAVWTMASTGSPVPLVPSVPSVPDAPAGPVTATVPLPPLARAT